MKPSGEATGEEFALFEAKQAEMDLTKKAPKPIYIKLTPGTELYEKVLSVSNEMDVAPTRAGRMMLRAGWLGFSRYVAFAAKRGKK